MSQDQNISRGFQERRNITWRLEKPWILFMLIGWVGIWVVITVPILLGLFTCVVPLGHAAEKKPVPKLAGDVEKFKERRVLCDHFRGEDPYDKERRKFLEENLKKYCTGTDKKLASLKAKYKNNKTVMKVLGKYEEKIELGN